MMRDPRRETAASEIVRRELEVLEERFGTSAEAPASGEWLPFHNASHAAIVTAYATEAARSLAQGGRLPVDDVSLARIAAVFHDDVQHLGSGGNERASAEAAVAAMRAQRYAHLFDDTDCTKVTAAILATTVTFENGMLHQAVDDSADEPVVLLQRVLADADLSSLGRSDGVRQALLLFAEWEAQKGALTLPRTASELCDWTPDAQTWAAFIRSQERLFRTHRFWLAESNDKLAGQQQVNAAFIADAAELSYGEMLQQVLPETSRRDVVRDFRLSQRG